MADEPTPNELSIIVDLASAPFDFKSLYNHLSSQPPENADHHYWHFAGLRSYTIAIQTTDDKTLVARLLDKLRLIQRSPALFPPFWISPKQTSEASIETCQPADEVVKKNMKIDAFHSNQNYRFTYSAGALTQMNKYAYDAETEISDITDLVFFHDRIDLEFGGKEQKLRKTLKADLMDRCAVLMTEATGVTLFINMTGNAIDYIKAKAEPQSAATKQNVSYIRTASQHAQPFYSTVRLVVSISGEENSTEWKKRLHSCYTKFIEFFHRNHINECFGVIKSVPSTRDLSPDIGEMINNQTLSFIKQYCWQMLKSIGYRFQQRLNKAFVRKMHKIEDDDEFYQVGEIVGFAYWSRLFCTSRHVFICGVDPVNITSLICLLSYVGIEKRQPIWLLWMSHVKPANRGQNDTILNRSAGVLIDHRSITPTCPRSLWLRRRSVSVHWNWWRRTECCVKLNSAVNWCLLSWTWKMKTEDWTCFHRTVRWPDQILEDNSEDFIWFRSISTVEDGDVIGSGFWSRSARPNLSVSTSLPIAVERQTVLVLSSRGQGQFLVRRRFRVDGRLSRGENRGKTFRTYCPMLHQCRRNDWGRSMLSISVHPSSHSHSSRSHRPKWSTSTISIRRIRNTTSQMVWERCPLPHVIQ